MSDIQKAIEAYIDAQLKIAEYELIRNSANGALHKLLDGDDSPHVVRFSEWNGKEIINHCYIVQKDDTFIDITKAKEVGE